MSPIGLITCWFLCMRACAFNKHCTNQMVFLFERDNQALLCLFFGLRLLGQTTRTIIGNGMVRTLTITTITTTIMLGVSATR